MAASSTDNSTLSGRYSTDASDGAPPEKRATTVSEVPRSISTSPGSTVTSIERAVPSSSGTALGAMIAAMSVSRPAAMTDDTSSVNDARLIANHLSSCRPGVTERQSDTRAASSASRWTRADSTGLTPESADCRLTAVRTTSLRLGLCCSTSRAVSSQEGMRRFHRASNSPITPATTSAIDSRRSGRPDFGNIRHSATAGNSTISQQRA